MLQCQPMTIANKRFHESADLTHLILAVQRKFSFGAPFSTDSTSAGACDSSGSEKMDGTQVFAQFSEVGHTEAPDVSDIDMLMECQEEPLTWPQLSTPTFDCHWSSALGSCSGDESVISTGEVTLMVCNIPVLYTQELLLKEWPHNNAYNFLYLPRGSAGLFNLTYAFVNFTSEHSAMLFKELWQKRRLAHFHARQPLHITSAVVQGLEANLMKIKKKRTSRMEKRQCQPFIMVEGRRMNMATKPERLGSQTVPKHMNPLDQLLFCAEAPEYC